MSPGEASVLPFELRREAPHIMPLAVHNDADTQYACAQLPRGRDLMAVEVLKLYKLCKDSVQLLTMSVPRLRKEYFQVHIIFYTVTHLSIYSWVTVGNFITLVSGNSITDVQ